MGGVRYGEMFGKGAVYQNMRQGVGEIWCWGDTVDFAGMLSNVSTFILTKGAVREPVIHATFA
ncbi:hypothetical protein AGMMS49545_10970 [Betaproteobacteria bacterium]|nr:hypothetical protein AGMMS49545_10970 [Betaproteobacteria bacterium]GHU40030.1 hypothetical protein AGMMS50289_00960 [Betaproteobacteria bacterium]